MPSSCGLDNRLILKGVRTMDQMSRQTETSVVRPENNKAKRIVGVIFGVIEIILGLRLVFTLLGANPDNGFIKFIRSITQFIVGIFEGIFPKTAVDEAANAVFEPAIFIAMIIVALIAWAVFKLMTPNSSNRVQKSEYVNTAISDRQQNPYNNPQKSL